MRVVVTGAGGLVGSAATRRFRLSGAPAPSPTIVALKRHDLDITNADAVTRTIDKLHPDLILNCAVLGVDECERDPAAARAINVDGPTLLAAAAQRIGAAMVHFSSNYVFGGNEERFYEVDDRPSPVNVYGQTKAEGERAVSDRCSRAFIVRTSWVFGPGKDSFLATVHRRLARGERVRAVSDVWASTTYVEDLIGQVEEIIGRGIYGLHHVVNEGVCSNESFAREAARIVGADPKLVDVVSTREAHHAPRPRYTPLQTSPPLRDWREALAAYIESDARGAR